MAEFAVRDRAHAELILRAYDECGICSECPLHWSSKWNCNMQAEAAEDFLYFYHKDEVEKNGASVYTLNTWTEEKKQEVRDLLKAGKWVHLGSTALGHERARLTEYEGTNWLMEEYGEKVLVMRSGTYKYFKLNQ